MEKTHTTTSRDKLQAAADQVETMEKLADPRTDIVSYTELGGYGQLRLRDKRAYRDKLQAARQVEETV